MRVASTPSRHGGDNQGDLHEMRGALWTGDVGATGLAEAEASDCEVDLEGREGGEGRGVIVLDILVQHSHKVDVLIVVIMSIVMLLKSLLEWSRSAFSFWCCGWCSRTRVPWPLRGTSSTALSSSPSRFGTE